MRKNLINAYYLVLGTIVVSLIIFGLSKILTNLLAIKSEESNSTYFSYNQSDLNNIIGENKNLKINQDEIFWWDNQLFSEISKNNVPPTTASKIYAYYTVSQYDFGQLSKKISHEYAGSISPISVGVICQFFPSDCSNFGQFKSKDDYSNKLADIVMKKVVLRIASDNPQKVTIKTGDNLWYGDNPTTPDAGNWKTWQINSADQFIAQPPPTLNSPEDLKGLQLVREATLEITPNQKKAVLFWAGSSGSETLAGIWLKIANDQVKDNSISLASFLLVRRNLMTTIADAFIACWRSKFVYMTRRPFMRDPGIVTYIPTPNYPSYTSELSTISASASQILGFYFPSQKQKFADMAIEAKNSSLWAGIHFSDDNDQGFVIGKKVSQTILASLK